MSERVTEHEADDISRPSANPWLRRAEQMAWGLSLMVMLGFLAIHLIRQQVLRGRWIDIEQAPPLDNQFTVDINTADWPELTVLPGISETYARRIVAYRNKQGPFQSVDDMTKVHGIGSKTLDRIRPYVVVLREEERQPSQSMTTCHEIRTRGPVSTGR
jgi:competence protein ComEA